MKSTRKSEALGAAIRLELEGIDFYAKCAERSRSELARRMFRSLGGDEKRHAEIFRAMAEEEGVTPAGVDEMRRESPFQRMAAIFREAGKDLKKGLDPNDDDIKAIEIAKQMETKSFNFYAETARATGDADEKRILLRIAAEENEHYRILDDTKLYLTYPEMWFIKDEKPLIDGG